MKNNLVQLFLLLCFNLLSGNGMSQLPEEKVLKNQAFIIKPEKYGIAELQKTGDLYPTDYIRKGRLLGEVSVRFKQNGILDSARASINSKTDFLQDGKIVTRWQAGATNANAIRLSQTFELSSNALVWNIKLENTSTQLLSIEDLSLPLFYNNQGGENPKEILKKEL